MTDTASSSPFVPIAFDFPPARAVGALVEYGLSPRQRLYVVDVFFVGAAAPATDTLDRVLRGCVALAAQHRSNHDIFVSAALLPSAESDLDDATELDPYGPECFLCFDARLRQIGVRRHGAKRFEDAWAVTDVAVPGAADGAGDDEHPLDDDAGMDDELDDDTDAMRATVKEWIWYGYAPAGRISDWIDESAAEGEAFDVAWIKAFAVALMARKRFAEARWPEETDCDRLDRAFDSLDAQGICALQHAGNTMSDGFESVNEAINADGVPKDRYVGFCFFHSQDIDRALGDEGLMLAFGHLDSEDAADLVAVGRQVCEVLAQHGLRTVWNGSDNSRISLPDFRWQRRTPD